MGTLESELKKELRRTKVNAAIIHTIAAGGLIAMALVAPNVVGALGKIGFLPQRRYQTKQALSRMIEKGYVALEKKDGKPYVRLTEKGKHLAALMNMGKVAVEKPARWDGKWRLLIFDVSEKRRSIRSKIRRTLLTLGFMRLQDSVWVLPYECEDLMVLLKADLKIGKDVLYIIADKIENDAHLRAAFGLTHSK